VQGSILIVDAVSTNRIILKTKLSSSYYNVLQATSVREAVEMSLRNPPDLVVTALHLPDGDAAGLCESLAATPQTSHLPVLAIADAEDSAARQLVLSKGAQDVLVKPVSGTLLLSRVRSLIRARRKADEWVQRAETTRTFAFAETAGSFDLPARIEIVSDDRKRHISLAVQMRKTGHSRVTLSTFRDALQCLQNDTAPDVFVLVLNSDIRAALDQLNLISLIRANTETDGCGILIINPGSDAAVSAAALDLGADDLMQGALDQGELAMRLTGLTRRKRQVEHIQRCVDTGLREAIFDALTGLYNRRYAASELDRLTQKAATTGSSVAVMLADMDHFKSINDRFGHAAGDAVLVETARRLRALVRAEDMVARIGGEEFLLAIVNTTEADAKRLANRICKTFRDSPFRLPGISQSTTVTLSIGICMASGQDVAGSNGLINQADRALYAAKHRGRNCVRFVRPAA